MLASSAKLKQCVIFSIAFTNDITYLFLFGHISGHLQKDGQWYNLKRLKFQGAYLFHRN